MPAIDCGARDLGEPGSGGSRLSCACTFSSPSVPSMAACAPGVAVRNVAERTVSRAIFAATRAADSGRPSTNALLSAVRTEAAALSSA